jgi:hypothetical protein
MHIALRLEKTQSGCTYNGITMNVYRGIPVTPLQPGEYALLYGEKFFDFGVDPRLAKPARKASTALLTASGWVTGPM